MKPKTNKKNLRRINIVVNSQTLWHLHRLCAICGYSDKDIGRIVDKLVRIYCTERGGNGTDKI